MVGPKTLAGTRDPGRRLAALVPALFARYRFLSPWLQWSQHEAHLISELGAFHARFREQHLHRISANYLPHNTRSAGVLKRLGFTVDGYARDYLRIDGRWQDHILTSLVDPDWTPAPDRS